jgi:molecular chaperone DnaK
MAHLGIDLGTSNTLVALVDSSGEPVVKQIDGDWMVPSVVYVENDGGNPTVGRTALDMWADPGYDAHRCFRRWKLQMGEERTLDRLDVGGTFVAITPEYLTARLVEYVVAKFEGLGNESVESVLVTVPHGWRRERPERCRATRAAAAQARPAGREVTVQPLTVSEPVAAAAYWVWSARRSDRRDDLNGRVLLVCDVGGGTFDLSLVRVGAADEPLDVIAAVNSDLAGDYAAALVCAWACREFNRAHGTAYPATAEKVLKAVTGGEAGWLRQWFVQAETLKRSVSFRAEKQAARKDREPKPFPDTFTDPAGRSQPVVLSVAEMEKVLEPFYQQGRELLRGFLSGRDGERPYAVAFAGGGSRIWGVRQQVVAPTLAALYGEEEGERILGRIALADDRLDRSIALGAALVANRMVAVTERLTHDVGIVGRVPEPLAPLLGLRRGEQAILLTPVLRRGDPLPASRRAEEIGLVSTASTAAAELALTVVVGDASGEPCVQSCTIPNPVREKPRSIGWTLEVDGDGILTLKAGTPGEAPSEITGTLQPAGRGGEPAPLRFVARAGAPEALLPRVTPDALRQAIQSLRPV